MKVLIVGNGAREHAIAWKVSQSSLVDQIYIAPGNAGTAAIGINLPISSTDIENQARAAYEYGIGLTIVGPEAPLAAGIVNCFHERGLNIFGPTREAALIESSKSFAKMVMTKYQIPTGHTEVFDSYHEACRYVKSQPFPLVVKANGLASGKGVTVAKTEGEAINALHECLVQRTFGSSGDIVLIEECLEGREVSVFAFTDGKFVSPLVAACDYKRAHDGGSGPNTGGMGSYSPPHFWTPELQTEVRETIMLPTISALFQEGCPYRGVLYGGLMITENGPKVIEFNCRFGDPETQVILPRLATDLVEICLSIATGTLSTTPILWNTDTCVGVVMAPRGYPGSHATGQIISGLHQAATQGLVFHAGTRQYGGPGEKVVTDGGRVLTIVGRAAEMDQARAQAYEGISLCSLDGGFYRGDIATDIENH